MAFDPTLPLENTEIDAAQMRSQLNGLKALIDAAPGVTGVAVDGVTTVDPTNPAVVNMALVGSVLHFSFVIPRGEQGLVGPTGSQGETGNTGAEGVAGPQGPPFANAIVDTVNTLNPGEAASVVSSFDGNNVHFTFGIPRGADGVDGEVTNADLTTAINGTSSNSNGVSTLDTPFTNDPPTLADMELMRAKMNELILALRR